ncbi:MAG: CoA pyrophosphatase [Calditrichaeota bacterium]|nr:MAG: CoA pyrophosphatase [Calditrichota bacterium]
MNESSLKYISFSKAIERIRQRLSDFKPHILNHDAARNSAVTILFLDKEDRPYIIFTKRTDWVETHKGQISFPGGGEDETDKTLRDTAIRETYEEIGILPENIEIIGQMDDFYTVTDFIVSPFVGFVKNKFEYRLDEREVDRILEVPLELFLEDSSFEVKKWDHGGKAYDVYFYHYGDDVIWGATAFILNRFIDTVFGYNPAPGPVLGDPRNSHYLEENHNRKSRP